MNSRPMFLVILVACIPAALATSSYYQSGPAPAALSKTPAAVTVKSAGVTKPAPPVTKLGAVIQEMSKFDAYGENEQEQLEGVQEPIVSYLSDFECDEDGQCDSDEEDCESNES